jgi:hypothetical protein
MSARPARERGLVATSFFTFLSRLVAFFAFFAFFVAICFLLCSKDVPHFHPSAKARAVPMSRGTDARPHAADSMQDTRLASGRNSEITLKKSTPLKKSTQTIRTGRQTPTNYRQPAFFQGKPYSSKLFRREI